MDVEVLAKEAAQEADPDRVVSLLEPKIYVIDVVMAELVKQVQVGCAERGELLEKCRQHFLSMFSITAMALGEVDSRYRTQMEKSASLEATVGPLQTECALAVQKIASMDLDLKAAQETVAGVEEELETTKRSMSRTKELEERSRSQKELTLISQLEEADAITGILKSKLAVMEAQVKVAEQNNGVLQAQVQELQERVRRDAEHLDVLSENVARSKVRLAWMRALAFLKRHGKEKKESSVQVGESQLPPVGGDPLEGLPPAGEALVDTMGMEGAAAAEAGGAGAAVGGNESMQAKKKKGVLGSRGALPPGGNQAIPFERFWGTVIKLAEGIDFFRSPQLAMTKRGLLEFISRIYTEKILVDEVDDRSRMPRQSLSEFLYDYHLELLGEPQLAEEALINIVANLNQWIATSARVRMFARFLGLTKQPPLGVEPLNMFLIGLVKVQNGQIPLLPDFDTLHVESGRAIKVVEYVFAQAPYVVKTKILLECEKRAVGRQIDLDSFLFFLVDMWREEQARSEERLRALFVASDADGNGNLDFQEFHDMVKHINSTKTHRELLRMYGEMTLNRMVDSNTFVRVCRKFKFFTLELGPSIKRQDNSAAEVFELLTTEWAKIEDVIHELLVVLEGSAMGKRLEQDVFTLKKMLADKMEPEQAWVCYRKVVAECTSAIKNRTPPGAEPESPKPPPKAVSKSNRV